MLTLPSPVGRCAAATAESTSAAARPDVKLAARGAGSSIADAQSVGLPDEVLAGSLIGYRWCGGRQGRAARAVDLRSSPDNHRTTARIAATGEARVRETPAVPRVCQDGPGQVETRWTTRPSKAVELYLQRQGATGESVIDGLASICTPAVGGSIPSAPTHG